MFVVDSFVFLHCFHFFFFNDPPTPEIYTLSLHDALPIWAVPLALGSTMASSGTNACTRVFGGMGRLRTAKNRSEEHTSELQSRVDLVCRLLLEKKKKKKTSILHNNINKPEHHRTLHIAHT